MVDLNWHNKRFVFAPGLFDRPLVVLSDIDFWNSHYQELKDWCDKNDSELVGMTVEFYNEKALTLFCLRWS